MEISEFCTKLFRRAEQEGFTQYEIYYVEGEHFQVNVLHQEVDKYSMNTYCGLSFRVKQGSLISYVSTTILEESNIDNLISDIKNNFRILESTDEQFIYEGERFYPEVNNYNPELSAITPLDKIELAKRLEQEALNYNPKIIRVHSSVIISGEGSVLIRNNKGLNLFKKENYIAAYVIPIASENGRMSNALAYKCTRDYTQIDPTALSVEAATEAIEQLNAGSVPTGSYPAVIRAETMCDLLETFWSIFSADDVQRGLSLLGNKIGEQIASEKLTISDNPLLENALCSYPFDDEGVAAQNKNIIQNGKLITYLHNLKTAAKTGVHSTGNGTKASYSSPVSVAPSNLYINKGNYSKQELFNLMENGLYITDLEGMHSGANPSTGEFSLSAKGYLIHKGKISRAVNQITISGNFYQLLKDITAIGNDLSWGMPSSGVFGSPSVLLHSLSVAGE